MTNRAVSYTLCNRVQKGSGYMPAEVLGVVKPRYGAVGREDAGQESWTSTDEFHDALAVKVTILFVEPETIYHSKEPIPSESPTEETPDSLCLSSPLNSRLNHWV